MVIMMMEISNPGMPDSLIQMTNIILPVELIFALSSRVDGVFFLDDQWVPGEDTLPEPNDRMPVTACEPPFSYNFGSKISKHQDLDSVVIPNIYF